MNHVQFARIENIIFYFCRHLFMADDSGIGIIDSQLGCFHKIRPFVLHRILVRHIGGFQFGDEGAVQRFGKNIILNGVNHLGKGKKRIFRIQGFHIQWNQTGNPAIAMDDVRAPAQILNCFQHSFCEENGTLVIVREKWAAFVPKHAFSPKIIVAHAENGLICGKKTVYCS